MRVLVNALSLGSLSGQHVLFGHLSRLARWTLNDHEFLVLHHAAHASDVRHALPFSNVNFLQAPGIANHWATRSAWESVTIPSLIRRHAADRYFTPAGTILPKSPVPQISLAQNPWCLVPEIHRTTAERIKAGLQRTAYRRAATSADLMVYNSNHIRNLYQQNAAAQELAPSLIAFQGINDETHAIAEKSRANSIRRPFSVLSVSAMAHWKGAETVVTAIGLLRQKGIPAELTLVGPWPDPHYEAGIRRQITDQGLQDSVTIAGKVSVSELHNHYATARVYCLMSRCESFGIPAVEAQAFGTPVVGSSTCAMAEIGGEGGVYCAPGNPQNAADLLGRLLSDDEHWQTLSDNSAVNSQKYRWDLCSRPLMSMLGISESERSTPEAGTADQK